VNKIQRVALFAILALILLYAGDYILARFHPQPLGSVDVQIMWAIKQKDNRIDYELGDTETRPCVHSLFPQMGYAPCWYLTRHRNQTITVGSIPKTMPRRRCKQTVRIDARRPYADPGICRSIQRHALGSGTTAEVFRPGSAAQSTLVVATHFDDD
jgi:hypothetical protein